MRSETHQPRGAASAKASKCVWRSMGRLPVPASVPAAAVLLETGPGEGPITALGIQRIESADRGVTALIQRPEVAPDVPCLLPALVVSHLGGVTVKEAATSNQRGCNKGRNQAHIPPQRTPYTEGGP